jgi:hypothetical protein
MLMLAQPALVSLGDLIFILGAQVRSNMAFVGGDNHLKVATNRHIFGNHVQRVPTGGRFLTNFHPG